MDLLELHRQAGEAARTVVNRIGLEQWTAPTNCEMDVRGLVNHIVGGHLWAAELVDGKTIADIGGRFDGNLLGTCPFAAYDAAFAAAQSAFEQAGAFDRRCHLSYGDVPGAVYLSHRALDTFIHGWDVARATGQDNTLEPHVVDALYALFKPHESDLRASGAFGQLVDVPEDADPQTRLLALLGRDAQRR
jgi:uncharacterized protein (TIGR03086 family)